MLFHHFFTMFFCVYDRYRMADIETNYFIIRTAHMLRIFEGIPKWYDKLNEWSGNKFFDGSFIQDWKN